MDKCEVQSDCFVIRASKIKCAYPRRREIAFSILNTTLHSPQKHFPGLKTAIPCPGGNQRWSFRRARAAPSGNSQNYSLSRSRKSEALRLAKARRGAGRARRCDWQRLVPQQEEQVAAAGKSSYHSMESKALRPARAPTVAGRARRCRRQKLVPQQGEQGIAAGKGSSRSRVSEALRPQRLILQHEEQGAATGKG